MAIEQLVIEYVSTAEEHLINESKQWITPESSLLNLLTSWPNWTSLLPYALQESMRIGSSMAYSYATQVSPCPSAYSMLRCAICMFQLYDSKLRQSRHLDFDSCIYIRMWGSERLHECAERIGWDMAYALCHRLLEYLDDRLRHDYAISYSTKQCLFDLLWNKCIWDESREGYENLLTFLAASGCHVTGQDLCAYMRWAGTVSGGGNFMPKLVCDHLTREELHHDRCCPPGYSPQDIQRHSNFLGHWAEPYVAVVFLSDIHRLLQVFLGHGQSINSVCVVTGQTVLNAILTPIKFPSDRWYIREIKLILALKAGADPWIEGTTGTAFDAAQRLSKSHAELDPAISRKGEIEDSRITIQNIHKILKCYTSLEGRLPAAIDQYLHVLEKHYLQPAGYFGCKYFPRPGHPPDIDQYLHLDSDQDRSESHCNESVLQDSAIDSRKEEATTHEKLQRPGTGLSDGY